MRYAPAREPCPLPFAPFKSCTVPRPIGWLSTLSTDGVANLAPYSQWQNLGFDPPMVMFAANPLPDGRRKDTVVNAEETGWFVWNMATWDLREAVNVSAMALPPDADEFDRAGVAKSPAAEAQVNGTPVPMVAESPCHFECKHLATHRLPGRSTVGWVDVVYATVDQIHVDDRYVGVDGKLDIAALKPIARMGYYDYAVVTETFEMRIPEASDAASAGLEGRSAR